MILDAILIEIVLRLWSLSLLTVAKSTIVGKYETGPRTRISGRPWPGGEFTNFGLILINFFSPFVL